MKNNLFGPVGSFASNNDAESRFGYHLVGINPQCDAEASFGWNIQND